MIPMRRAPKICSLVLVTTAAAAWLAWRAIVGLVPSADEIKRLQAAYDQTIDNTLRDESIVGEFKQMFPAASHQISYFTAVVGRPEWHSEALVGPFEVELHFDVIIDRIAHTIRATGKYKFQIVKRSEATITPSGGTSIGYDADSQRDFGTDEWRAIVKGNRDFSVVGLPELTALVRR